MSRGWKSRLRPAREILMISFVRKMATVSIRPADVRRESPPAIETGRSEYLARRTCHPREQITALDCLENEAHRAKERAA